MKQMSCLTINFRFIYYS